MALAATNGHRVDAGLFGRNHANGNPAFCPCKPATTTDVRWWWPFDEFAPPSGDRSASAAIRKQLDWVVEAAHRIFANAFEIEIAFDKVGERAGQQHRSPQLFGEGFETRSHVDRRTDDGEVEPGARPDIAVHDVSDVDADAVIQRRTTGFAVLFVQGNHGLTGFGHGMQQICTGRRLAERKNGEQTVADEFQYLPAMSRNRLRHRVEIAI